MARVAENQNRAGWCVATAINPLLITTELARKVPLLIRTMLGTNLHGLGFSVPYQKFDEGL